MLFHMSRKTGTEPGTHPNRQVVLKPGSYTLKKRSEQAYQTKVYLLTYLPAEDFFDRNKKKSWVVDLASDFKKKTQKKQVFQTKG